MIYISYGAGVQSTALLICSSRGLHGIPKADAAIFADTGDEPQWVYDTLAVAKERSTIPVHLVRRHDTTGSMLDDITGALEGRRKRFASVPLFTRSGTGRGMLRRQCTREYKIDPIERCVRWMLGYRPRQRIPENSATAMIGISIDEVRRMKPSRTRWITNTWPLVDAKLDRQACAELVWHQWGIRPLRSSCIYCPYHSDAYWQTMRREHPEEWRKAIEADHRLRNQTKRGLKQPAFVHSSLQPLERLQLCDDQLELQGEGFDNECEGMCGV